LLILPHGDGIGPSGRTPKEDEVQVYWPLYSWQDYW